MSNEEPWPWSMGTSDKFVQNYTPVYFRIAAELGPAARVCEVGGWHGHALRLFQALFPYGHIVGVDYNSDVMPYWPSGVVKIVSYQDNPQLPELIGGGPFDLIIDDASHDGNLTAKTFAMLWPLISPGGYYVVEDWRVDLPDMLGFAGNLLNLLETQDAECDQITYQYGLAVVHKRREPAITVAMWEERLNR